MRTSALFGAKNSGFFLIYGVVTWTRGVEPGWTFCRQGGQFFVVLCWRLLWWPLTVSWCGRWRIANFTFRFYISNSAVWLILQETPTKSFVCD